MKSKLLIRTCLAAAALIVPLMIGCKNGQIPQSSSEQRRIAEACLAMLRSSLTNESDIAVNDARIPQVIRALHPVAIVLAGNDVVVMCSGKPAEYHLNHRSSEPRVWILYAAGGVWGSEHRELLKISE